MAIVITDASFHEEGDFADFCRVAPPNDGDAVTENNGLGEDYPSIAQIKTSLQEKPEIIPVFLVADDCRYVYEQLVEEVQRGTVVNLSLNSSNFLSAIQEGLGNIFSGTK